MTGASFGAFLFPIVARPFLNPVAAGSVFAGSLLLEPVPTYFLDWKTGLAFSATQFGLLGMAALSSVALQLEQLAQFFFSNFANISLYSTSIVYKLGDVKYVYRWRGNTIFKEVAFFLFRYQSGEIDVLTEQMRKEVDRAFWLPLDEALARLTYPGEREMAGKAKGLLSARGR